MEIENLKLIAWIKRSSYRYSVVETLNKNSLMMPMQIANETGINKHHISNVLSALKEKGIVECINEEESKGRMYRMTDLGKDVFMLSKEI